MPIIRNDPCKTSYTIIPNKSIRDKDLSLAARGLHHLLVSFSANWQVNVSHLTTICKEGRDKIYKLIKELESHGYIHRTQAKVNGKFAQTVFTVYLSPFTENPYTETPYTETPYTENPDVYKVTNPQSTEIKKELFYERSDIANEKTSQEEDRKLAELFGQTLEEDQEPKEKKESLSTDSMAKKEKDSDPANNLCFGKVMSTQVICEKEKSNSSASGVKKTSSQSRCVSSRHEQVRAMIGELTGDVDGFLKWRMGHLASTSYYKDNGIKVVESTVLEGYAKGLKAFGSDAEKAQAIADVADRIKAHVESWPQRHRKAQQDSQNTLFEELYSLHQKDPEAAFKRAQGLRVWNQFYREKLA